MTKKTTSKKSVSQNQTASLAIQGNTSIIPEPIT